MTLYTRKGGQFRELTRAQLRRLRRVDQVVNAQQHAQQLVRTTRALAAWLDVIRKKGLHISNSDLTVTRLPNIDRLRKMCDTTAAALEALKHV